MGRNFYDYSGFQPKTTLMTNLIFRNKILLLEAIEFQWVWQDNDPLPLGDEVSMGVISRPESENNRTNFNQGNSFKGVDNKTIKR